MTMVDFFKIFYGFYVKVNTTSPMDLHHGVKCRQIYKSHEFVMGYKTSETKSGSSKVYLLVDPTQLIAILIYPKQGPPKKNGRPPRKTT